MTWGRHGRHSRTHDSIILSSATTLSSTCISYRKCNRGCVYIVGTPYPVIISNSQI